MNIIQQYSVYCHTPGIDALEQKIKMHSTLSPLCMDRILGTPAYFNGQEAAMNLSQTDVQALLSQLETTGNRQGMITINGVQVHYRLERLEFGSVRVVLQTGNGKIQMATYEVDSNNGRVTEGPMEWPAVHGEVAAYQGSFREALGAILQDLR